MPLIDEKGRIFGAMNILDAVILVFVIILVASLLLYSKYPQKLKEHRDATFQMYFPDVPDAIAKQVFVPGTSLIATYAKDDKAVIIDVKKVSIHLQGTGFLVTINGSLEVDAEGDLLFNGNDIAPGNYDYLVQIENSYLTGRVWRVDYEHSLQTIEVIVKLTDAAQFTNVTTVSAEDVIFDEFGYEIGKIVTSRKEEELLYATLSLQADVYDGALFISEMPIQQLAPLYFAVNNTFYHGIIVEVNQ